MITAVGTSASGKCNEFSTNLTADFSCINISLTNYETTENILKIQYSREFVMVKCNSFGQKHSTKKMKYLNNIRIIIIIEYIYFIENSPAKCNFEHLVLII